MRALLDALLDVARDPGMGGRRDDRAHFGRQVAAVEDLQRLGTLQQFWHDFVSHVADQHGHRDRHAAFARRAITRADQCVDHLIDVGVRHDHHVVLRAAQGLHAFAMASTGLVDVIGDRRGADEGHRFHIRVDQQRIDRLFVALHHVEHAVRQTGLFQQIRHEQAGARIGRAWLENEGVARRDRHREHPHRHHHREVERRDAGHHAQGLAQGPVVDVGRDLLGVVALEQLRDAAGELDDLDAARYFALGVGENFAVLGGDHARQCVAVFIEQRQELEQDAGATQRRQRRPGGKRGRCRFHCRIDFSGIGEGHFADDGTDGRVGDVLRATGSTVRHAAVNVVCDVCWLVAHGGCPLVVDKSHLLLLSGVRQAADGSPARVKVGQPKDHVK
ncbi:hypothetical protein D3C84_615730 [compost metagenome]